MKHILIILAAVSAFTILSCTPDGNRLADNLIEITPPSGTNISMYPNLYTDGSGTTYMSWIANREADNMYVLQYSILAGDRWEDPEVIAEGSDWFVNWADFPSVVGERGNPLAAHWLHKIPGSPYSYNVNVTLNNGAERHWSPPLTPHQDNTPTEHGFVSMIPWQADSVLVVWLDGRNTHHRSDGEYFDMEKAMSLRSAVIAPDGSVHQKRVIDGDVCDCCQTSLIKTEEGALVAYRDRAEGEIRDIYTSRYVDGIWSEPAPVHHDDWQIGACPVNGPRLAVNGGTIIAAWYTAAGNERRVKAAISTDHGRSFGSPVVIDDGNPIGRVDAVVTGTETSYVSWMERVNDKAEWRLKTIGQGETENAPGVTIAELSQSRSTGFPRMSYDGSRLIFAWTETGDRPVLKTAVLPQPG